MSLAKRMDALRAKGFRFTVDARYNFRPGKKFNVTTPAGSTLREAFDSIAAAVRFCEGL